MKTRVWFAIVAAILLLAFMFMSYRAEKNATDNQKPRKIGIGFMLAALFPLALVGFALSQRIDTFSFGSIVFAVLLEAVVYVGWAASPQEEADSYLYMATGLPFVLIVVTLLFNTLQKEA